MTKPFWWAVVLLVVFVVGNIRRKRWPSADHCIELLAYGAGLYSGIEFFRKGYDQIQSGEAWMLLTAAATVSLVSCKGIYNVIVAGPVRPVRVPDPSAPRRRPNDPP